MCHLSTVRGDIVLYNCVICALTVHVCADDEENALPQTMYYSVVTVRMSEFSSAAPATFPPPSTSCVIGAPCRHKGRISTTTRNDFSHMFPVMSLVCFVDGA